MINTYIFPYLFLFQWTFAIKRHSNASRDCKMSDEREPPPMNDLDDAQDQDDDDLFADAREVRFSVNILMQRLCDHLKPTHFSFISIYHTVVHTLIILALVWVRMVNDDHQLARGELLTSVLQEIILWVSLDMLKIFHSHCNCLLLLIFKTPVIYQHNMLQVFLPPTDEHADY